MFKLFYTLLVIEYVVEDQDVATSVIFPSEKACYDAMGDGVMDNLYDILADTYGKEIMMYCQTHTVYVRCKENLTTRPKAEAKWVIKI